MQVDALTERPDLVHVCDVSGVRVASILIDVDVDSADRVLPLLQNAAGDRDEFILSLQCCDFCDSYGLAMIIAFARQIGDRCVVTAGPRLRSIFELRGFNAVVKLASTVADALMLLKAVPTHSSAYAMERSR